MRKLLIFALFGYVTGISAMEILDCRFVQITRSQSLASTYTYYVADVLGIDLAAGASCILTLNEFENITRTSGFIKCEPLNATQYQITHLDRREGAIYIDDARSRTPGAHYMGRSIIVFDSTLIEPDDTASRKRYIEEKAKNTELSRQRDR